MEVADPASGRRCFERFGNRGGGGANGIAIERAGRAGLIEKREKLFASLVVMLPGIFPVEHNRDGDLFLRRIVNDLPQPAEDIVCCHLRSRLVVDEAEGIGDLPIAKQYRDFLTFRSDRVGLIEILLPLPRLLGRVERAGQDAFVGRQPAESDLRQQRNQLRTDGALRRPEAYGGAAERGGMKFDRAA